jgi:uncharacterized protein (TIGR03083 family)
VARIRQYYGPGGVPLVMEYDPHDPVIAWRTQRARLRDWLDDLPDDAWGGPTRCESWDTAALVRHLTSASQFLGYTLGEAASGTSTCLLEGMDTRGTVEAAAAMLGDREPAVARAFLAETDAIATEALAVLGDDGLSAMAEAPPGRVPVHLAVSHFLFDSWVHEYDLLVPRGQDPVIDPLETMVVVGYLVGLASVAADEPTPLDVRLVDTDLRVGVDVVDGTTMVVFGDAPAGAWVLEGPVVEFVDRITGRGGSAMTGDDRGLAVLDGFAAVLAT